MARVVRRRNNPPILLIVFVFLFIIAAAVAVLMYMQRDEAAKSLVAGTNTKIEDNKTIKEYKSWNAQMAKGITGRGSSTKAALSQIDFTHAMLKESGHVERGGLLPTMLKFDKMLKTQKDLVDARGETIKQLQGQLTAKGGEMTTQKSKYQAEIDKWVTSDAKLSEDLAKVNKQREDDKTEFKKKFDSMLDTAQSEKAQLLDEQEKLIEQASRDKTEIRRLKIENEDLKERLYGRKGEKIPAHSSGEIIRVTGDGICFVGLGSKDKVKPGLTFSVYKKGEMDDKNAKGKLRITKVDENFSTCEIVEENKDSPIVQGDIVANPAYHSTRPPVFVIIGGFDLHGRGTSPQDGFEELVSAVKSFGGKVEDEISYRTDYLVVGNEPERPAKPSEDAPPAVHKAYERLRKKYDVYLASKAEAKTMKIPVLNLNRFLLLTGYTPEKVPE